jgi:hypothetical protein
MNPGSAEISLLIRKYCVLSRVASEALDDRTDARSTGGNTSRSEITHQREVVGADWELIEYWALRQLTKTEPIEIKQQPDCAIT